MESSKVRCLKTAKVEGSSYSELLSILQEKMISSARQGKSGDTIDLVWIQDSTDMRSLPKTTDGKLPSAGALDRAFQEVFEEVSFYSEWININPWYLRVGFLLHERNKRDAQKS